jgi:surface protein
MFNGATSFNQDIRSWVTSSVTDMGAMFESAVAFDQPIPKSGSQWDTTLVKDMSNMFFGAAAFNQDLSTWVTQSVTDMSGMFQSALLFNYGMVTSGSVWDTSSVVNMNNMFNGATSFNQNISSWNTALVTDMGAMFQSAVAFNQPIPKSGSQWDTSLVTDMSNMFGGATAFNQDIGSWVVSAVANFDSMFSGATSFNKNITGWIGAGGASANNMFSGATAWIARYEHTSNPGNSFHGPASSWTGPVPFANLAALQTAVTNCLNSAPSGACTCSPSVDCGAALYEPITNWDTSLVADMNALFQSATLFNANIGSWNTEQVTRMDNMFSGAAAFNQPIGSWNVTAVTDASFMFQGATAFVHDITGWVLSQTPQANVTSMFVNAIAWINERDRIDGSASLDGPPSAWYTPAPPPPPSPPPPPPPTCGNGVYDAAGTNPDGTLGETCEPYGNSIDNTVLVQGCDPATCAPFENWQCNDPSTIGTPDYNCTCNNPAGTYALPDVNFCARVKCVYADRCLSEGRGCAPGAGGNACDRCYTAQDIVDLGLEASLAKAGYYKTGQTCTECPGTSAGQLFAAATLVVVLAFFGFKASQVMGPQATNNLKKIIESLQFFSLSLSMDIKWPGPVLNLGKYLEAFTFSVDFLRPECVATGLNWLNIFLASVFVVPALIFFIIVFNNFRSRRRFERTVRSIHCERRDGGAMVYWIERPGRLWGIRRTFESKGGDKIVKELQRQYRFRASLRSFGVLSMTVLYLPIVRMCLQAFDCLEIDGIESTRLEHDIDIDCESTSHVTIQAAAAVMLAIVGIGMPIYVISQVRKLSNTGKLDDPQTIDAYGPFYDIYRREDLTYSHKLEIARLRQTTVRSRSIPRGSDDEDDREETTFDTETERVADEIENDIRQDIEEPNEGTSLETTDGPTDDVEQGEDFNPELGKKKVFGKGRKSKDGRLAQVLSMSKSMLQRTPSAQARERVKKMSWKDRFSVYYLSVELCQKSGVILMTSPFISASPLSGWGLVFIHWFLGIFVYICQPWRIITLSFFGFKVSNCLNKVETMAAFLQGVTPALAMIWPVKRDADGIVQESFTLEMMTGLMTAIITGLLAIRIIVFVGERVAVKRAKMDIDKEPEACIEIVREKLVEMAKKRAVVSLFAFKADFDITRRKARARIEITRQAMLTRIDTLKSEMASTEGQGIDYTEQKTALYEVANQMAHIVNTVVPMPPPVGPAVEERIDALEAQLSKLSVAEDERYVAARQESEPSPNAAAMHIIFKVHIIDCIVAQVNEQLEVYACAELVSDLAVLGRRHAELLSEQSAITSQFGDSELRATSDELSSSAVPLLEANERDDFEKVSSTLHHCASVIDAHAQWCMTQSELFSGLKREHPTFLPDEPPLTTECFESCIKDLKTHEKQMELVRTQCISDWLPMFKHFGCVKYLRGFAEQIRNQLSLSLNGEITPEEAKVVYDDTVAFMDGFASWCADLCGIIETSDVFNEFQPIASAMMKSLKVIQIDAKKQSMLAQKVLSAVDYALAQKSTAEAVRNNLQQALRDLTSKMEEHLAVQMDEMKNEKIALERAYEEEKVQTEEDINVLEKTFAERKATMEREFALQRDIVERLLVMKQEEKAAVAPSLNPFRRVRFEYENELASANKECLRISRALEREENVKNMQCENLLRAMQQTERQLRAQIKIHDSLMAKMEADVLDHLKKQGNVAQKRTAHDIAANKAVLASRKAIYKQQRIAAQLYVSVERETTRAQVGLTRTKLAVAKRKGLLVRTTSRLTGKSLRSKSRKKAHDENETVKDDQQEKEVEDQTAVDEKSNVTETKT